jgi:hypothetical protein
MEKQMMLNALLEAADYATEKAHRADMANTPNAAMFCRERASNYRKLAERIAANEVIVAVPQ